MQGNIYKLKNGILEGKIYNVLQYHTGDVEGHFTVHFNNIGELIGVFKHGDYAKSSVLNSYEPIEFNGYLKLSNSAKNFFEKQVKETLPRLQYYDGIEIKKVGTLWVFNKE